MYYFFSHSLSNNMRARTWLAKYYEQSLATVLNFKPSLSPSVCRIYADVCHNILTSYESTKRIYLLKMFRRSYPKHIGFIKSLNSTCYSNITFSQLNYSFRFPTKLKVKPCLEVK